MAFCDLGPVAERFITAAAGAGTTSLKSDLAVLLRLERAHGRDALRRALERALEFRRFRASDVSSILLAGHGVAQPTRAGTTLITHLPVVASRPLEDYAMEVNS